jgi:hypothetical protein
MSSAELSLLVFAACNTLRVIAYLPQIAMLIRRPESAASFSHASWLLFSAANASTAAYAWLVLADSLVATFSALSTLCGALLIGLALWRRMQPVAGAPA